MSIDFLFAFGCLFVNQVCARPRVAASIRTSRQKITRFLKLISDQIPLQRMSFGEIQIKNMVCPRCIEAVKKSLEDFQIPFESIELGKVSLSQALSPIQKTALAQSLERKGFELLESKTGALISQVKSLIIEQVHHSDQGLNENFSSFLSDKLNHEYTSLSRLFSQVEGITIEKYITRQKIERVKELLFYDQQSLSEIAFALGYSSVAYLSSQFKKETGMTPSEFKKNHPGERKSLDQV